MTDGVRRLSDRERAWPGDQHGRPGTEPATAPEPADRGGLGTVSYAAWEMVPSGGRRRSRTTCG
ncbi:predicted protein [Streptomyces sp. AA4]|nr:predicted protein [Streptomyces sp. AA4]